MPENLNMNFRLKTDLHRAFVEKAKSENRTASDVMRELMQNYVDKDKVVIKPAISQEEKARRAKAFEFARASVALEGYSMSDEAMTQCQRFIDGEITLDELVNDGI